MLPKNTTLTNVNFTQDDLSKITDIVSDYLSDVYGYCVNGYNMNINIEVNDIDWDTEE